MIYFNKERLTPAQEGIVTLAVPEGGYCYVKADVYGQAYHIRSQYRQKMKDLVSYIVSTAMKDRPNQIQATMANILDIMETEMLPEPINTLAPFLAFTDIENIDQTPENLIGILGVIACNINFVGILNTPKEIWAAIRFSLGILEEVNSLHDMFRTTCTVYGVPAYQPTPTPSIPVAETPAPIPVPVTTPATAPEPEPVGEDKEEEEEEGGVMSFFEGVFDDMEDLFGDLMKEDDDEEEESAPAATPAPAAPAADPAPAAQTPQVPSFAGLMGGK